MALDQHDSGFSIDYYVPEPGDDGLPQPFDRIVPSNKLLQNKPLAGWQGKYMKSHFFA